MNRGETSITTMIDGLASQFRGHHCRLLQAGEVGGWMVWGRKTKLYHNYIGASFRIDHLGLLGPLALLEDTSDDLVGTGENIVRPVWSTRPSVKQEA